MKEIIEKISSYNIFNYLLPGVLFAVFAETITGYKVVQSNIIVALFLYYFIGMVISRVGSLCFEPLANKLLLTKFADYPDFVRASKMDAKINTLSQENNTYRTICSLFIVIGVLKLYEVVALKIGVPDRSDPYVLCVALFLVFLMAYRKQTAYIVRRIEAASK